MRKFSLIALMITTAHAQRVNFAKFQQVTASVHNSTYVADFAVDGVVSNFHSWRTGDRPGPKWLEVNYPRPVTLASAHLYLGLINSSPVQIYRSFKLQSHNGSDWIDIPGTAITGNTNPEVNLVFSAPVTSARFRFLSTDSGSRSLRQLALFPPNLVDEVEQGFPLGTDITLNLAYKRPATSSSARRDDPGGAGYAKNAFDGYRDDTSRWLSSPSVGEWIEVDLLSSHTLGSAHVYSGTVGQSNPRLTTNPLADFTLQSWNGDAWVPIPGAEVTGNSETARVIQFTTPVTTSRVRLVTTVNSSNARLQELLLFPPRDGGYALGREVIDATPPSDNWMRFQDFARGLRCNPSSTIDRRLGLVNGTVVFAGGGAGTTALRWQLLYNYRNNTYRIRHLATGQCLALAEISTQPNTRVVVEDYSGLPHQEWILDPVIEKPNNFRIINAYSGLALRTAGSWDNNTPMAVGNIVPTAATQHWFSQGTPVPFPKKGIAATGGQADPPLSETNPSWMAHFYDHYRNSSWSYSWGRSKKSAFPFMAKDHVFNPMQWGGGMDHGRGSGVLDRLRPELHSSPLPVSVMGFNEPDGEKQANLTVASAIAQWPRLEAMEMPLVSPGPVNAPNPWIDEFYQQADDLGYRIDYTSVHWYKAPNANQLINQLETVFQQYGRPIWLTEFSAVRWTGNATWTHADNYNFLAEFLWRAESLPWLARYSLFNFREGAAGENQSASDPAEAPRSNAIRADGTLTAFGEFYAGWDAVTNVLPGKAYHLHNRGAYRRLRNPEIASEVTAVDPETAATGCQWTLVTGTTEGTFQIKSTRDGRLLRFYQGVPVSLAVATATATFTEWRVVPHEHGWYFIEHPNSNQRLRAAANGNVTLGAINETSEAFQWRFAVPAVPEAAAPPESPAPPTAHALINEIALAWSAVPGAENYSVQRSANAAGPWQEVATGLTGLTWSDANLLFETSHFYTITAHNVFGSSGPSFSASATTGHPFSAYATWQILKLHTQPADDQLPTADPDQDGQTNLLEFAFLTDPLESSVSPFRIKNVGPATVTLEFPWNWRAVDLTWQIRHGQDLSNSAAWPVVSLVSTTTTRLGDLDQITVTPARTHPVGFYVLAVIQN